MSFNHNGRHYVFPAAEWIPREWRHVLCTCHDKHDTYLDLEKTFCRLCTSCHLIKRFYASHCSKCSEFYIMAFKHADWTPLENTCWPCTLDKYGDILRTGIAPPAWISPQVPKTQEELSADLGSLFDDDEPLVVSSFFD